MSYAVAVDIGGTFTDLVAFDQASSRAIYTKSPTNYDNFVDGILDCFRKASLAPRDATLVNHGTTLVINSLIQRRGAKTALVTSEGFRDILEIARGNRPDPFDLHYQRDEPLIPRELRFEVPERIDFKGRVVTALDEEGLRRTAEQARELGVESLAVFFLNSYVDPTDEERAAALLQKLLPDTFVTVSSSLSREWYEYERASTAAANAFVGPQMRKYVSRLETELSRNGFDGSLYMMGSNGGVLSVERTLQAPIALVESGPVGGCIGAGFYAKQLGFDNVIAFDMGGTTAKCALVEDGSFSVDSVYYAAGYVNGFPIKSPVIDIVEVGSGGGSIAWLDRQNQLHVGPQSAASTPGPVCYGRGGTEPTVTDANLVLGRLNPANFLGGELKLDGDGARDAIRDRIAAPLGYHGSSGVVEMANGIIAIATVMMAGAIRKVSVEHGRDPRDFILFCYGGGGPIHGSALARELSIPTVVVPLEPGNFSAVGMLLADARIDESKTFVGRLRAESVAEVSATFAELERSTIEAFAREFGTREVTFERYAEMRYVGQRHSIKVALTGLATIEELRRAFDEDYRRRYGISDEKAQVEFQAIHLSGFGVLSRPDIARLKREATGHIPATTRMVHFGPGEAVETKVYSRYALERGFSSVGPAVIEEYGSTTLVWPNDRFEIGPMYEIRIDCASE